MAWPALPDCNLFFFDSETGTLDPSTGDMLEVGVILTDPKGKILEEYCAKVFPEKPVDPKAAAVNGYSEEKWAVEAIPLDHAMIKMMSMARNAVFVSHNNVFDWGFFSVAMGRRMMRYPGPYHKVDTVALSLPLLLSGKVPNIKLATLTEYFGIAHENAHTALADVRACYHLYMKLMDLYGPAIQQLPVHPALLG